jgi:hypothetical protein
MTKPYCFDIETLLNECQPQSLLLVGAGARPVAERYREQKRSLGRECHVDEISPDTPLESLEQRYDMGVITDTIEYMEKRDAYLLLSRLRDLHTARFCAVVRLGSDWPDLASTWTRNELLGIGMMLVNSYEPDSGRRLQLYKYDIATYKPTPRWLNPEDWANPELWNKYRW